MIKAFCDRCNNEIIGDIYRITFSAESSKKLNGEPYDLSDELKKISNILNTNIPALRMYCKECKDKIEAFAFGNNHFY